MNTMKLLKLAPTLIMAAVMAYAAYSIDPQMPPAPVSPAATTPAASKGGDPPDPGTRQTRDADDRRLEAGPKSLCGARQARPGERRPGPISPWAWETGWTPTSRSCRD